MENIKLSQQWKLFYRIGAIAVFLAVITMLTEIFLTSLPDGARVQLSIQEIYDMYDRNWFMAMRNMGLMNIIATSLMIPVFFALYGLHRETSQVLAGISLITGIISYVIFMSDNVSFAFLELARKYVAATTETEKTLLITAGEALFAKGASHTPGTFPGFFTGEIAGILFSIVIIKGKQMRNIAGIIGIIAFTFLMMFEIVSSFIISLWDFAMIFAMFGGIAAIIWYLIIGIGLWKNSK